MASILTPVDVVRRIYTECTFIDERGAVGIRLKPAAAIVRQHGEQFRRLSPRKQNRRCSDQPAHDYFEQVKTPATQSTSRALPVGGMMWWPVSACVENVKNNNPSQIEPITT